MESLKINGTNCGHCTDSVKKVLGMTDDLSQIIIELGKKEASFENDGASGKDIRTAIRVIGFEL